MGMEPGVGVVTMLLHGNRGRDGGNAGVGMLGEEGLGARGAGWTKSK